MADQIKQPQDLVHEASFLGLAPGEWPDSIVYDDRTFEFRGWEKRNEIAVYGEVNGRDRLTVLND